MLKLVRGQILNAAGTVAIRRAARGKYFVVSLPRTGTSSLCEMARRCGLRALHDAKAALPAAIDSYDFFADTPCYLPAVIAGLPPDGKLIYSAKDPAAWYDSWRRMGLGDGHDAFMAALNDRNYAERFADHRRQVFAAAAGRQMLIYEFAQGWEHFCRFLDVPIPNCPLPWLNRHSCFDFVSC